MKPYIIAVDIGGSHISSMVINRQNWNIDSAKLTTTKTDCFGSQAEIIKQWATNIQKTAKQIPLESKLQIAIAMPGPFDYEKGVFQLHPEGKMSSLAKKKFEDVIAPFFKEMPVISFENDAACFGLGEACFGLSKNAQRSIGVTLGTGIGTSFIANQTIIKSNKALPEGGELYAEPYQNSIADDYFSTRWFVRQAKQDLDIQVNGVRELIEQAPSNYLPSLFDKFTHNLFRFLMPYAKEFEAETIVIGGNITKAWSYFGHLLNQKFQAQNMMVQPTVLNEKAIMLGAAKVFETKNNV